MKNILIIFTIFFILLSSYWMYIGFDYAILIIPYLIILLLFKQRKYIKFNIIILSVISILGLILLGDMYHMFIKIDFVMEFFVFILLCILSGIFIIFNGFILIKKYFGKK